MPGQKLVIDGLVENPLRLKLSDLKKLPEVSFHAVLECAGNGRALHKPKVGGIQWEKGAVGNAEWTGVRLKDLLLKARVKPEARFLRVEGADKPALPSIPGWARSIPLAKALDNHTLLALKMNREEMPVLHGGPLRLVLPDWYGQNWIKWLTHITLTEGEDPGFFQQKGYRMPKKPVKPGEEWNSATGTPVEQLLVQTLITSPRSSEAIPLGKLAVSGKAFSGAGAITKVEISTDNGKQWYLATLEPRHDDGGWQSFSYSLENKKVGPLTILSRATDAAGAVQPLTPQWNPSGYLRNWVDSVSVVVSKTVPTLAGLELVEDRCYICHTPEMIKSQRLGQPAWAKVLKKMQTFGSLLSKEEFETVLKYLSSNYGPDKPVEPVVFADYAVESEIVSPHADSGKVSRGKELYATHCSACHGTTAQGKIGPRLKGRLVPAANFWAAVVHGKNSMPSFSESLKTEQIADLRSFLNEFSLSP